MSTVRHMWPPRERGSLSWIKLNTQFQITWRGFYAYNLHFLLTRFSRLRTVKDGEERERELCCSWPRPRPSTTAATVAAANRNREREQRIGWRRKKKKSVENYKDLNTRFEIVCLNPRFEIKCSSWANSDSPAHVTDTRSAQLPSIELFL